jgi:mannosyltransferase OCH1-like enzyme
MIPKILHYCWFGNNPFPKTEKKCFKTWEKYLNDYDFKKWDEGNFNVNINEYVKEAYEAKKWMYVSDYARLWVLYNYGGLYLDTDCLVKKSFNTLLNDGAFTGFGGDNKELMSPTIGAEKGHPYIKECLDSYENEHFINPDGTYNDKTINIRMTEILKKYGFKENGEKQTINGITVYPMTYFSPSSFLPDSVPDCYSKDTYCVHIWSDKRLKLEKNPIYKFLHKIYVILKKG